LPAGFVARPEAGEDSSGWPLEIECQRDGMILRLIPAGRYLVGRAGGSAAEGPAHQVELTPYYIDRHEVTVGQYARFRDQLARQGESIAPRASELTLHVPTSSHPIVLVTQVEAEAYARWVGRSLPTEVQWETAARGPDGRIVPWGEQGRGPGPRDLRKMEQVMTVSADLSPFGVHDLAGNAAEWTSDWYEGRHYDSLRGTIPLNPAGPSRNRSGQRTIRGSSKTWQVSYREGMRPETRLPYLGFRCVLNLPADQAADRPGAGQTPFAEAPLAPTRPVQPAPATPPNSPPPPPSGGNVVPF
jgi:formylglycine-generating enzyme required for sulfatase activity